MMVKGTEPTCLDSNLSSAAFQLCGHETRHTLSMPQFYLKNADNNPYKIVSSPRTAMRIKLC